MLVSVGADSFVVVVVGGMVVVMSCRFLLSVHLFYSCIPLSFSSSPSHRPCLLFVFFLAAVATLLFICVSSSKSRPNPLYLFHSILSSPSCIPNTALPSPPLPFFQSIPQGEDGREGGREGSIQIHAFITQDSLSFVITTTTTTTINSSSSSGSSSYSFSFCSAFSRSINLSHHRASLS